MSLKKKLQNQISGEVGWQYQSYELPDTGKHSLLWEYVKDEEPDTYSGDDCGWVDYLQGTFTEDQNDWENITYTYDHYGRRTEKEIDETTTRKFVYDGGHVIAESATG